MTYRFTSICITVLLTLLFLNSVATATFDQDRALHQAIKQKNRPEVTQLLDHGADIESRSIEWPFDTPLEATIRSNNIDMATILLDKKCQVNGRRDNGEPLSLACHIGKTNMVALLFKYGANTKYCTKALLLEALETGHTDIAQVLLEHVPYINLGIFELDSAFSLAVYRGYTDIVTQMLPRCYANGPDFLGPALMKASRKGHADIVQLLLNHEACDLKAINYATWLGKTALAVASAYGHTNIVKMLLSNGAEIKYQQGGYLPYDSLNPLDEAAKNGHLDTVELLLRRGATVTPEIISHAFHAGHAQIASLLSRHIASNEECREVKIPFLLQAAKDGYKEFVTLLLDQKIPIESHQQFCFETPLICAAEYGHAELVNLLINRGAKVEACDCYGNTALLKAAKGGHANVVDLLLDRGARVRARNFHHNTALLWAVRGDHVETARVLLDHGADTSAKNTEDRRTPLAYAREKGYVEMIALLHRYGAEK